MWSLLKKVWGSIFPRSPRVIALEKLNPEELEALLPSNRRDLGENTAALFSYQHPLTKEVVWEVKYRGNQELADTLGTLLYDALSAELAERHWFEKHGQILLMPSPISDKRRFERGWNQAELLTQALKTNDVSNHFKYLPRQLIKIVHTESQARTGSRSERLHNLQNSMLVQNPEKIRGQAVVLIDDVITTGATLAEARRALREAGAKKIFCLALAH